MPSDNRYRDRRAWFLAIMANQQCSRCDVAHPAVLDWHHLEPKYKLGEIGVLVSKGYSEHNILTEMSKCIVLCANCHRILHWEERNDPWRS